MVTGTGGIVGSKGKEVFIRKSSGLTRQIGAADTLLFAAVNTGTLIMTLNLLFALQTFPGANMYSALLIGLLILPIFAMYWLLSTAMPRSGGEYVYITRVLPPVLGLVVSFIITIVAVSFVGVGTWLLINYVWAPMFYALHYTTGQDWPTQVGLALSTPAWQAVVGSVAVALMGLAFFRGTRLVMRLIWVGMTLAVIGTLTVILLPVTVGHATFVANFDKLSGTSYQAVLNAGQKAGIPLTAALGTTVGAGFSFGFLGMLGANFSANIAGEIRSVQRSQGIAMLASPMITLLLWGLMFVGFYGLVGHDFYQSLASLAGSGDKSYTLATPPTFSVLLGFTGSSAAVIIFSVCFALANQIALLGIGFACIRNVFAWGFERLVPTGFANVDRKGRPWWAALGVVVLGELYLLLAIYQPKFITDQLYSVPTWMVGWVILGIAAALFPYRRKDLFKAAPSIVQSRWLNVPVVTILGVVSALAAGAALYYSAQPFFSGSIPIDGLITGAVIIIAPFVIYFVAKAYNAGKGIPISVQFTSLPPE